MKNVPFLAVLVAGHVRERLLPLFMEQRAGINLLGPLLVELAAGFLDFLPRKNFSSGAGHPLLPVVSGACGEKIPAWVWLGSFFALFYHNL